MNQDNIGNTNPDDIKVSGKNKKSILVWQILFLAIGSVVAVLLCVDSGSGFMGLGISAYWLLLLIPALFAFPIAIKKSILLLIPVVLFPLTVIAISVSWNYFDYVLLYCWLLTFFAVPGIVVGFLIRLARSKEVFVRILGIIALAVILVVVFNYISNPLLKSHEQIKESILELTPIGTSKEQVISVIEANEKWHKNYNYYNGQRKYEHFDHGYLMRYNHPEIRYHGFQNIDEADIIGKETIKAPIGTYTNFAYGFPLDTSVYVYWAFDENANLIDVAITKETDGF